MGSRTVTAIYRLNLKRLPTGPSPANIPPPWKSWWVRNQYACGLNITSASPVCWFKSAVWSWTLEWGWWRSSSCFSARLFFSHHAAGAFLVGNSGQFRTRWEFFQFILSDGGEKAAITQGWMTLRRITLQPADPFLCSFSAFCARNSACLTINLLPGEVIFNEPPLSKLIPLFNIIHFLHTLFPSHAISMALDYNVQIFLRGCLQFSGSELVAQPGFDSRATVAGF